MSTLASPRSPAFDKAQGETKHCKHLRITRSLQDREIYNLQPKALEALETLVKAFLQCLENLIRPRYGELAALLDVCDLHLEVVDEKREPPGTSPESLLRKIELEAQRAGVRPRSISEELHVFVLGVSLSPGLHYKGVVDCKHLLIIDIKCEPTYALRKRYLLIVLLIY